MPAQGPQWTEFLSCHVCFNMFDERVHRPISLGCGHTLCKACLSNLSNGKCPFDQSAISRNVDELPANYALLQLVGAAIPKNMRENEETAITPEDQGCYTTCNKCIEDLAVNLKSDAADLKSDDTQDDEYSKNSHMGNLPSNSLLSRPMQRKLVALVNCQLLEEEGRSRAMRAARSLGERAVTELILQHQNPHQLSANLWAAVRTRGCQFLGPAMQEEVLRLILLVLEDASALSRKVLVLFVVQQLEESYPQASKTAIGHVVQLLYRASCFKVTKREEESSLMQLKEEFRTYEALRREHDSQIVQIAMEAGLRISPEQWSSLLYGDTSHKSHMQSIIDKLQTPQSFTQSLNELSIALQRTGDPCNLQHLRPHLEFLANVDPSPDAPHPTWENLEAVLKALRTVVQGLVGFFSSNSMKKNELLPLQNARYKTSMCRDQTQQGMCPRGNSCTFAHSQEELERYRARSKRLGVKGAGLTPTSAALSPKEKAELDKVNKMTSQKLASHIKQPETVGQSKPNIAENSFKSPKETVMTQSLANLSLSPKALPPADNVAVSAGPNSGIPKGNTTPSVAAPAYYRTPALGAGTSVKETYFHPRMPQGATRMTPYEMEGHRYNNPGYMMNPPLQGVGAPVGQYPPMNYPKSEVPMHKQGFPPNPYNMCDHQRSLTGAEQWGTPQQCYGQSDTLYEAQMQWPHHGNNQPPGYSQQPFYQGQSPSSFQSPPPTTPPYSSQGREYLNNLHDRRNKILAHLHQQGNSRTGRNGKSRWPLHGSRSGQNPGHCKKTNPQAASTMGLAESVADTYVAARTMFSLATSGLLTEPQAVSSSYVPWSSDDCSDMNEKLDPKIDQTLAWVSDELTPKQQTVTAETEIDEDDVKSLFSWFEEETVKFKNVEDYSRSSSSLQSGADFIPFGEPLVSKFGPIARMSRSRLRNTNPVQVTADETMKTMTPVTAVKAMDCPLPVPSQVPTRFCVHEIPTYTTSIPAIPTGQEVLSPKWHNSPESQFMLQSDPTGLSRKHLQQEVARLENRAQDAANKDESLAYELQAINLKISLQTGQKPQSKNFPSKPVISESSKSLGSVRASDPALTVEEHRKLHELATTMGSSGKQCSEQQERLLSQLLKLQDLGKQSSQKLKH